MFQPVRPSCGREADGVHRHRGVEEGGIENRKWVAGGQWNAAGNGSIRLLMGSACELHDVVVVVVVVVAQVGLDKSSCSIGVDTRRADIRDVGLVGKEKEKLR